MGLFFQRDNVEEAEKIEYLHIIIMFLKDNRNNSSIEDDGKITFQNIFIVT